VVIHFYIVPNGTNQIFFSYIPKGFVNKIQTVKFQICYIYYWFSQTLTSLSCPLEVVKNRFYNKCNNVVSNWSDLQCILAVNSVHLITICENNGYIVTVINIIDLTMCANDSFMTMNLQRICIHMKAFIRNYLFTLFKHNIQT